MSKYVYITSTGLGKQGHSSQTECGSCVRTVTAEELNNLFTFPPWWCYTDSDHSSYSLLDCVQFVHVFAELQDPK